MMKLPLGIYEAMRCHIFQRKLDSEIKMLFFEGQAYYIAFETFDAMYTYRPMQKKPEKCFE